MSAIVRVSDIMATSLLTFTPQQEINQALKQLLNNGYSGAPVLNANGLVIGVLSQRDCIKAVLNAHYHHAPGGTVNDYMAKDVETLDPDMELSEVAYHFINSRYRRFPVVDNITLVGQLSRCDVLRSLNKQWI